MTGQKIKQLRTTRKITQRELGKLVGVSHATIAMWEGGQRQIDLAHAKQIANIFNVSVDWLIDNDDNTASFKLLKDEFAVVLIGKGGIVKTAKLDEFQFQTLEKFVDSLVEERQD